MYNHSEGLPQPNTALYQDNGHILRQFGDYDPSLLTFLLEPSADPYAFTGDGAYPFDVPANCQPLVLNDNPGVIDFRGHVNNVGLLDDGSYPMDLDSSCHDAATDAQSQLKTLADHSHSSFHPQNAIITAGNTPRIIRNSETESSNSSFGSEIRCSVCGRQFHRRQRAESCENKHTGAKPYLCGGSCGRENCTATFSSKSGLTRHCRPKKERTRRCNQCGSSVLRQNFARHQRGCMETPELGISMA